MELSSYRIMWIFVMFDLPVDSAQSRHDYTVFRKMLLRNGFQRMQFSVYNRYCMSEENAQVFIRRIESNLPPDGMVSILMVTDKQFERIKNFWGPMRKPKTKQPQQLELF